MDQLQISKTMDVEQMREEEKDNQLEDDQKIREDFYYDESELEKRKKVSVINDDITKFQSLYGFDSEKRENFQLVSRNKVGYSSGISYMLLDIEKNKTKIIQSRDGGGIGCIAIHPDNDYIAVAEKGDWPNIYVYDYPELNLYRILKKGAEKSYSNIVFSHDGNTIASVSNDPDYLLSIWDWKKQQIMLKSKAFSQEIYKIQFSFYQPDVLATMGTGHIKFWKIAETFTGLKLKGQIAKFGTQEISDVITCYHFSDGKILSSTEYGNMLLWEGNLIKCVIGLSEDKGVHDGAVESIFKEDNYIVTTGRDGMIKYWSYSEIDNCEPDDNINYFPKLQCEIYLGGSLVDLQRIDDRWIIHDKLGTLSLMDAFSAKVIATIDQDNKNEAQQKTLTEQYRLQNEQFQTQMDQQSAELTPEQVTEMTEGQQKEEELQQKTLADLEQKRTYTVEEGDIQVLLKLNNGGIKGNALSENLMMSLSEDNKLSLTDLSTEQQLAVKQMDTHKNTQGTAMDMKPNTQLECASGYSNGIMRVTLVNKSDHDQHTILVKKSYKVFDNQITHIAYNPSGELMVCVSSKGEIFLLEHYMPYCLFETQMIINSIVFNQFGNKLLIGLNDGRVIEVRVPKADQSDCSETYLQTLDILREQKIKMMDFQKPKVEDMDIDFIIKKKNAAPGSDKDPKDDEWDAKAIQKAVYYDQDCRYALVAVGDVYAGHLYVFDFIADRPIHHIEVNKEPITYMHMDMKVNILFLGTVTGKVELRHREGPEDHWLQLECHDQDYGSVHKVLFNNAHTHIVSSSQDGTIRVNAIDYDTLLNQFKGMDYVENYKFLEPEKTLVNKIQPIEEEDTQDTGQYCLQQAKLLLNEDLQRKEAEKKKNGMRQEIQALRTEFTKIKAENDSKGAVLQLNNEQMEVDGEFQTMFQQRMDDEVEETGKVLEYDIQYNKVKTQKIRNYMIDELVIDKFAVKVIRNQKIQVKTFKLQKMSQFLQENLELNYKEIEEQQQNERDEQTEKKEEQQINEKEQEKDRYDIDLDELEIQYDQELEAKGLKEGAQKRKEKRKMLEERINEAIDELKKEEPTREAFDPDHKKEIAEAYSKFGDYKLKNDKEYVVPENQRMNVGKKRKHLFLLEEFVYNSKLKFNNEVIQLRELKKFITQKVKGNNERIRQINNDLGIQETLQEIVIDKDNEYPESKLEILNEDESLAEEQKKEQEKKLQEKADRKKEKESKQEIKELVISANIKNRKGYKIEKSQMEIMTEKIREMKLQAEKKKLKEEMDKLINDFDIEVVKLSNEKNIIEGDLMIAKMKLTTFYQELLILEDMEEKDNSLIEDLIKLRKEKQSLEEQTIQLINNLLGIKENEVKIEKTLADLMKQFKELVHQDDDIARNKIHEHYRKQFKMKKAKQIKQLNDDEELNEDEEEEEEEDEGYDQEDDEDKPDTTPIESDPKSKEILESIVQNEDEQETNKKIRQDLEGNKKMITNKTNQLLLRLENTENELKDYQRVKLQKLNKIDVSIILNLNQIQNLFLVRQNYIAPDDLLTSILFTQGDLTNLNTRIVQLKMEKDKIQSNKNHLKRKKNHIDKELARLQQDFLKLQKDYEEKHMLKFGYIMDKEKMDLKFLEAFEPSKQLLDMRAKYKKEENSSIRKIEEAQNQLIETKKELLQAKKENTGIIQSITDLGKQQITLNKQLDSTNKKLFKQQNEDLKMSNERDKKNLKELINFLNKLIIDLKGEIGIFKRKGGHIYTLVSNNTKQ